MVAISIKELEAAQCISGPHEMFSGSFILEGLQIPASLDASTVFRVTYLHSSPLLRLGKSHPQAPPLHLHFSQSETCIVTKGKMGITSTYNYEDRICTRDSGFHEIKPWVPHKFWPVADAGEDTVMYMIVHPSNVAEPMDWLFFRNLLGLVSDMEEKKMEMGMLGTMVQIMVTQHASETALVLFPTAWWLGPLRWWVPWRLQGGIAALGRMLGYRALMEKYTPQEDWDEYSRAKRL